MIDEGSLRERFPEILWDQPVLVKVAVGPESPLASVQRWCCRYCIAAQGMKGADVLTGSVPFAYVIRDEALDHIEREHHD